MNGRAPSSFSALAKTMTLWRYCALFVVHGVVVCAPKSSFSAIHGWAQPADAAAR